MELNGKTVMLANSNDIIILENSENEIVNTAESLINPSKNMGFYIKENKIKYIGNVQKCRK